MEPLPVINTVCSPPLFFLLIMTEIWITGYGGFNISINPFFSGAILSFVQKCKGILAVPNIRGGGEFGREWHLAGTRERKVNISRMIYHIRLLTVDSFAQVNCFDDFIAAS